MAASMKRNFDAEYAHVEGQYKRLKYVGNSDVINEYSAEYHAQIWDYATFELNEKIYNNLVEFDVDVRYAVDLMSMSMDFQFAVPFKADRDDITKSLTNYTAGFDKSLFNIIAAETDVTQELL